MFKRITSRLRRVLRLTLKWLCLFGVFYVVMCLIGLIPVNQDFENQTQGVKIYVVADALHTELILPTVHESMDWRRLFPKHHFAGVRKELPYIAFSWGDRRFFIETPTWEKMKISVTLRAMLLPTSSIMHVTLMQVPAGRSDCRKLVITRTQYLRLAAFIRDSFAEKNDARLAPIRGAAYGKFDAFYPAVGKYHLLNTCNNWTGRGLKRSGVKVSWWSPFAASVMYHLPK